MSVKHFIYANLPSAMLVQLAKLRTLVQHPSDSINRIKQDLQKDKAAKRGVVSYPQHFVFIAGLPKSGTTWVEALWQNVPSFVSYERSFLRHFDAFDTVHSPHDLHVKFFSRIPKDRYSYLKRHTHYSEDNEAILRQFDIKPIVVIRDIRDMLISRYHHAMEDPRHWMHQRLVNLNFEQGFMTSMDLQQSSSQLQYYNNWIQGWLDYQDRCPNDVLIVKYEDMLADVAGALDNMLRFHNIELSAEAIQAIIARQKQGYKKGASLGENLKRAPGEKNTFRKGKSGEWRHQLSDAHLAAIEQVAGATLKRCGYQSSFE